MDLAYLDKLANENKGEKYLLVGQQLFNRTVDAERRKRKDSKEAVRAFLTMFTRKNRHKKVWIDNGTEFAGDFKKLCKGEWIQIYSTLSETTAAFAKRTIWSLKKGIYRYMEDPGYKYIQKLCHFGTTWCSRKNCSTDLIPKKDKKFQLLVHSVQQATTGN